MQRWGGSMEVVLAPYAGACYGVQRALNIVHELIDDAASVSTLGPLIHNPQVVSELESKGVHVAQSLDDIKGDTIVIRSHGISPFVRQKIDALGLTVVDATCPHVARAHAAALKLARDHCRVLVIGEAGHPEVEGIKDYAQSEGVKADVVLAPDEIPTDLFEPVGVVVQTTQTRENLDAVVDALKDRGYDPVVEDTICTATQKRQKTAADLAAQLDAMVVIGGRNSSNTTRLFEICSKYCPRTFHIERAEELAHEDLSGIEKIGVTAGASTPEDQIAEVVRYLEGL